MKNILPSTLLALALIGCGSSSEPKLPENNQPTEPGPQPKPEPAARTLINRPLLMTSPQNLLLDIGFRDAGWGHFTSFYDNFSAQVSVTSRTFSVSPASVTAPIGIFKDTAATDEKSKGIVSLCSFLGGKGPFVARVWVSRSNVAGDPLELEEDATVFRAALTTGGYPEGKAYDLARKDVKVLGGRQWVLFEGRVEGELPSTAFFNLKFGKRGGGYMVQAPEVIAEPLMGGAKTMAWTAPISARAVTVDEGAAIAAYVRQPHQLGLPKVPIAIP
jgi:hypothetical protein